MLSERDQAAEERDRLAHATAPGVYLVTLGQDPVAFESLRLAEGEMEIQEQIQSLGEG